MTRTATLLATLVFVAACAGGGASPTPVPTSTAGPTSTPATGGGETVKLAQTSLGMVLVSSDGMTLYGFTPDETAGKPTCNEGCDSTWPPLTVTGDFSVGAGLDKTQFKLVTRDDGSMQLQAGDYPLYNYAPDVNPGDVTGQGKGGKWFVVGADGEIIQTS